MPRRLTHEMSKFVPSNRRVPAIKSAITRTPSQPKDTLSKVTKSANSPPRKVLNYFDQCISEAAMLCRSSGPEGKKRLLTQLQRQRLSEALEVMPSKERNQLKTLLQTFKGNGAVVTRGLILRSVAAFADKLGDDPGLIKKIQDFGKSLHKLDPEDLLTRASVLDLDSRINTNPKDPLPMANKRGVIHAVDETDDCADNDGLFQRFTASCGPTVLQMMICEANPMNAFALHAADLFSDSSVDEAADFQRKVLEDCQGIAIGRREAQLRARVRNAVGRLKREKIVTAKDAQVFHGYWAQGGQRSTIATKVLKVLRKRFDGFPNRSELQKLRAASPMPKRDEGISSDELISAIQKHLTPLTGTAYAQTNPGHGFARGQAWRHLDAVEKAVRTGIDIPMGVREPGHWMLITHVKGRKPHRSFLVSDPDGGRTAYVSERSLVKGDFVDKQFKLCEKGERGYVDCFLLPT